MRLEVLIRIYEFRELDERMEKFALKIAAKYPMSLSDAVLAARAEEDDEL